jgi:oxalate decarboxylase/phosphoglucose isomerase-like protein (cupin superfamily)
MGNRAFVVQADNVMPFSPEGREHAYRSQVIIGPDGAKSQNIYLTRFTVLAGQAMSGHAHTPGMGDEVYYILRGHARLFIAPEIGSSEREEHEIGPETAIFIPAGTFHRLDNTQGTEDLVLLTLWNHPPVPGSNGIHDARIKAWGTTFRLVTS